MNACDKGNLELVKESFKEVDQNTKERGLGIAVKENKSQIIKFLLEEGVNPNINYFSLFQFRSILFRMAEIGNKEMIELYLAKGGNLNAIDQGSWNSLHYSASDGHLETTKFLVSLGLDFKAKTRDGRTPLDVAIERNQQEIIKFLEEVSKSPWNYWNPKVINEQFMKSCKDGNLEIARNCFKKVDRTLQEEALGIACFENKNEIIKSLLKEGVNPNIKHLEIPIFIKLSEIGNNELVDLYLVKGGNLNVVDSKKRSAIHYSALNGHLETTKHLFLKGIDFLTKDDDGKTPLDLAIKQNKKECIEFLQEKHEETKSNPELVEILRKLDLFQFFKKFHSQHIEYYMLERMKEESFEKLGMTTGQTMKLMIEIQDKNKVKEIEKEIQRESRKKQKVEVNPNSYSNTIPVDFIGHFGVKKWEIEEGIELGSGSNGDVVKGVWNKITVAIKKLKMSKMTEENAKSFKNEANLMFKLRHPHIVQLLGFVSEEPCMLIMEFVEKGNLASYLTNSNNDLSWKRKQNFTLQIAQGMLYLHEKGALHRDLKSLNILITNKPDVKISDFGMASLKKELNDPTKSSHAAAIGTMAWMAPELLNGQKNTKESDVFAFGVICWEMATHRFPWQGTAPIVIFSALAQGKRQEIPNETPPKYSDLIESCWHQNPKVRPTFHQIVNSIEKMQL